MSIARAQMPLEFRLLGQVEFETYLRLQSRLQRENHRTLSPKITILFCEHPRLITVGRDGSRAHIRLTDQHLQRRRLAVRWVTRRGGCVPHGPGQLAIYAIAPLDAMGVDSEQFRRRLCGALMSALLSLQINATADPDAQAIYARSGVLAVLGQSEKSDITGYGAYLNVNPDMSDFAYVDSHLSKKSSQATMSSLITETRSAGRMAKVRSAIIEAIATEFDSHRYHLLTGHPMLRDSS